MNAIALFFGLLALWSAVFSIAFVFWARVDPHLEKGKKNVELRILMTACAAFLLIFVAIFSLDPATILGTSDLPLRAGLCAGAALSGIFVSYGAFACAFFMSNAIGKEKNGDGIRP